MAGKSVPEQIYGGTGSMDQRKYKDVKLIVNNEESLYIPFSEGDEFSFSVRDYIKAKYAGAEIGDLLRLTVVSAVPIDEDRFRSAVANWVYEEKLKFRQEEKITNRMLIGFLVIASLFIILSLRLEQSVDVLAYTIIPVLGSVALGRAAGICLTDLPINRARKQMLNDMEHNSPIIFELQEAEQTTSQGTLP